MQTLIVILIVVVAAVYVARIFYKGFKQKEDCSCGCTCCSHTDTCSEPAASQAHGTVAVRDDRPGSGRNESQRSNNQ